MDTWVLRIFKREIERQCSFGLMAARDLDSALSQGDLDRVWYSVQALLVAAGNVSKLMWPSNPEHRARGEMLRAKLRMKEVSVLEPRTFRNHFEHFDERFEAWARSSQRRIFVDSNIMPPGAIQGEMEAADFLRNLDPDGLVLSFRGDTYELRPVIHAMKAVGAGML